MIQYQELALQFYRQVHHRAEGDDEVPGPLAVVEGQQQGLLDVGGLPEPVQMVHHQHCGAAGLT